jgi:hypothetical protein
MRYVRLVDGRWSNNVLVPQAENIYNILKNTKSCYYSTYTYNETHKVQFDKTKSVAGIIDDIKTDIVWWDFDHKEDPDVARVSAITLVEKLVADGFTLENMLITFSGNKGFHVILKSEEEINQQQVINIAYHYAADLKGFDESMYDSNQVLRVPLTQNEKSGLFCIPITYDELTMLPLESIRKEAETTDNFDSESVRSHMQAAMFPKTLLELKAPELELPTTVGESYDDDGKWHPETLDFTRKPAHLDNARFLLMNGYFRGSESSDQGERSNAFLCLGATFKNLGYPLDASFGLLQGIAQLQSKRTGDTLFSDRELNSNILKQVYSSSWRGGQFSIFDEGSWLYKYAKKMNVLEEQIESTPIVAFVDSGNEFSKYIKSFKSNSLKFNLPKLDKQFPMPAGTNVGIIGAASSGKTLVALKLLSNASKSGMLCIFASLDMSKSRMFEKVLYFITEGRYTREELFDMWEDREGQKKLKKLMEEAFGNVYMYNKSAPTIKNIREYVNEVEIKTGKEAELLMIDYFERVSSEYTDDTKSSKMVASEIQDIVNDKPAIRVLTLVQPAKYALGGGPDNPLLSYTAIKGSSFLYQSFRQILSIWRPFFTPQTKDLDKYMEMAILKNDLGELDTFQFNFSGKKGDIWEMEDIERQELRELLEMKNSSKKEESQGGWK